MDVLLPMCGALNIMLTWKSETEQSGAYNCQGIKSLIDLMENNWLNPLSPDESDLISLSTGIVTPPAVVKDLVRAFDVGEEA